MSKLTISVSIPMLNRGRVPLAPPEQKHPYEHQQ